MGNRTCTFPGCDREVVYTTLGFCRRCYDRTTRRQGTSKTPAWLPDQHRFEANIEPGADGCWNWTGRTNRPDGGYGVINLQGRKRVYAHRWSFEYHRAEIPEGLEIDHLCRNTICVNPWHLDPVTGAENMLRTPAAQSGFCKRGHEYTPENTITLTSGNGRRKCRTCTNLMAAKAKAKRPPRPPMRSAFCKNGHPLSGENLIEKSGVRVCRACRRKAAALTNAKRWGTPLP